MPKIIIDHREDKKLIRELAKTNEVIVKQLQIADIIVQTRDFKGKIRKVGIERKTQHDFINSIIDKRILNQLINLKENFDAPLLIIEGSQNIYTLRKFHPNAIRGMLASIAIDFQVPILNTKNYRDTASLVNLIAKRLEKSRSVISLIKKRKPLTLDEQKQYIIESFPGVGPTIAKNILKKFKTIEKFINADIEKLEKIDKIGKIKAEKIKEVLN